MNRALALHTLSLANVHNNRVFISSVPMYCNLYAPICWFPQHIGNFMVSEFVYRDHSRNDADALHRHVNHINSRNDVLEFAKSSIVAVFDVWILFGLRRPWLLNIKHRMITANDSRIFTSLRTKTWKRIFTSLFAKIFKLVFSSSQRSG